MNGLTRALLLACASGVLLVLSQAPFSFLPAAVLMPMPLVLLAELRCSARVRYLAAYVGGLLAFGVGCAWLRFTAPANLIMMMGPEGLAFPFVVVLLRLGPRRGVRGAIHLAVAWTAIEYMRCYVPFNGYPWLLLGYGAAKPLAMAQAADLVGVFGISFLFAGIGGLTLSAVRFSSDRRVCGALGVGLLLAMYGYGVWRAPRVLEGTRPGPRVALVQGNVRQELKVRQSMEEILLPYKEASLSIVDALVSGEAPIDLLVWPETMIPGWWLHDPEVMAPDADARYAVRSRETERLLVEEFLVPRVLDPLGCSALVGALTWDAVDPVTGGTYNTAVLLDPSGQRVGYYDKSVLVPGGEYIPAGEYLPEWVFDGVRALAGFVPNLTAGAGPKVLSFGSSSSRPRPSTTAFPSRTSGTEAEWSFAPTICYENCYPGYNLRAVNLGADFLLNISNEAWFRDSVEMDQMEVSSRFRAIETRRTLVRATNSGITAIYDAAGRRRAILRDGAGRDREIGGVLIRDVPISRSGSLYRRVGDLIGVMAMIVALVRAASALGRRYLLRRST